MIHHRLQWKPKAKSRPRHRNGQFRSYTPNDQKLAEQFIRDQWNAEVEPLEGYLGVSLHLRDEFFDLYIWEVDKPESKMRGDVDNLAKTPLDALNGLAWGDDRQIKSLETIIR